MSPCNNCAYRVSVPGSAHIGCCYDWQPLTAPTLPVDPAKSLHGFRNGWFNFPLEFDPTWGSDECQAYAAKADPDRKLEEPSLRVSVLVMMVFRVMTS